MDLSFLHLDPAVKVHSFTCVKLSSLMRESKVREGIKMLSLRFHCLLGHSGILNLLQPSF